MEEIIEDAPVVEVPYGDLYLRFPDEATAIAALYSSFEVEVPVMKDAEITVYLMQGKADADGEREDYRTEQPKEGAVILDSWTEQSHVFSHNEVQTEFVPRYDMSIDTIGIIYDTDSTDPENPISTPEEGWHVNTRGEMPDTLTPFAVHPVQPRRVWA